MLRSSPRPRLPSPEPGRPLPRTDVLGVAVHTLTIDLALREIGRRVDERDAGYITITGVHGVMESQRSPELLAIHNEAALVIARTLDSRISLVIRRNGMRLGPCALRSGK